MNKQQNHEEITNEMINALEFLDESQTPPIPNEKYFNQLVHETKQNMKQKFYRDLVYFFIASCVVLTLVVISLLKSPDVFLIFQGLTIVLCPVGFYLLQRKNRQESQNAS